MRALRNQDRTGSLSGAILTSVVARASYAVVPVIAIPVGLSELGAAGFGAWVTALSTASVVAFADLGIGTGLMTKVGALDVDQGTDRHDAQRLVSSAYALALAASTVVIGALVLSAPLLDWASLLNAAEQKPLVEGVVLITLASYACNISALLVVRVQYALGQQVRSNLWQTAGSLAMLVALLVAPRLAENGLVFVTLVMFAPVLVAAGNTLQFFAGRVGRRVCPTLGRIGWVTIKTLLATGLRFVTVSILMAVAIAADPWIVARSAALEAVPQYAIPYRMFALLGSVALLMSLPLWPRHARAVAQGNFEWMRAVTVRMTTLCGAMYLVVAAITLAWGPKVLTWLLPNLGTGERVTYTLWLALGLWWLAQVVASPAFMVQNGAEILRPQTIGYAIVLGLLPVKWLMAKEFGFQIVPWFSFVTYCAVIWPACAIGYRQAIRIAMGNSQGARVPTSHASANGG